MINWREVPLVRIVLAMMTGIWWADRHPAAFDIFPYLLTGSFLVSSWLTWRRIPFRQRWWFGAAISICWFSLGYVRFACDTVDRDPSHFSHALSEQDRFLGFVSGEPSAGQYTRLPFQVTGRVDSSGRVWPCSGKILVYLHRDSVEALLPVRYGDEMILSARVVPVAGPLNPDAFDYRKYLYYQRIAHQTFAKAGEWMPTGTNRGKRVWKTAYYCRDYCIRVIGKYVHGENEYAVAIALLLGYKETIPGEVEKAYIQTGSMHILAVSGLHVGLIYLLIAQVFGRMRWRRLGGVIAEVMITLGIVWGFAILTGASASVLRAAAMFTFLIIGIKFRRFVNIYNTIAASVLFLLLWNPFLLFDAGFQLSYAAVLGIVVFQQQIYGLLIFMHRLPDAAWKLTSVGIAAQMGTLPLSLYYFHAFPPWFWLSGLIAIPVSTLALYAGIALVALDGISPLVAGPVGGLFEGLIWLMNHTIFVVQRFPFSVVDGIWLTGGDAVLLAGSLFLLTVAIQTRKAKRLIWVAGCLGIMTVISGFRAVKQYFRGEIVVYQVRGQTLVDWTEGRKVYAFVSDSLTSDLENQAAQMHRWRNGAKVAGRFTLDSTAAGWGFRYDAGNLVCREKTCAIVRALPDMLPERAWELDYLILCDDPNAGIDELLQHFRPSVIVADASNPKYRIKQWKKDATDRGIPFHDTSTQGAFRVLLE